MSLLVTVPPSLRLKVTEMAALFSPETVTTPVSAVASMDVAPLVTPELRLRTGAPGGVASLSAAKTTVLEAAVLVMPSETL